MSQKTEFFVDCRQIKPRLLKCVPFIHMLSTNPYSSSQPTTWATSLVMRALEVCCLCWEQRVGATGLWAVLVRAHEDLPFLVSMLTSQKKGLNMWMISSNSYFRCIDLFIHVLIKLYTVWSGKITLQKVRKRGRNRNCPQTMREKYQAVCWLVMLFLFVISVAAEAECVTSSEKSTHSRITVSFCFKFSDFKLLKKWWVSVCSQTKPIKNSVTVI